MTPNDVDVVVAIRGDDTQGKQVKRTLDDIAGSGARAQGATDALAKQFKSLDTIAALLERQLKQSADNTATLQKAMDNAAGGAEAAARKFHALKGAADALTASVAPVKLALDNAAKAGKETITISDRLHGAWGRLKDAAGDLRTMLAALGIALGIRAILHAADSYAIVERKIRDATAATGDFVKVNNELFDISMRNGTVLESTEDIFEKLTISGREFGKTNTEILKVTDAVLGLAKTAATANDNMLAEATMFARMMSDGKINAQEFGGIIKKIPELATAIADGFQLSVPKLQAAIVEGRVLSKDVFEVLLRQSGEIAEKVSKIPLTFGQSVTNLGTAWDKFVGKLDSSLGVTSGLAVAMNSLAGSISTIADELPGAIEQLSKYISGFEIYQKIKGYIAPPDPMGAFKQGAQQLAGRGGATGSSGKNPYDWFGGGGYVGTIPKVVGGKDDGWKPTLGPSTKELQQAQQELDAIQNKLKSVVDGTRTWQEEIAELERLRPFAKTAEQITALDRAIDKVRLDVEKNSPLAKAFASFADGIDDGFKKAFETGFSRTSGGFKKMLEGLKASFTSFLADLAYTALARPIMLNIMTSVGGSLGLSGSALGSILGTGGGTSSSGGTGGAGSLVSGLGNLSNLFGNNTGLTTGVNAIGNMLGIGTGSTFTPGFGWIDYGSNLSGMSSFTNGSFGGSLGAGIGGFAGNMLGNMVFGGDRGIGSTIGGSIGAIAGSFIPVPIVGPLIGSFLGNAIGGLFGGGKPSAMAQWGQLDLSTMQTANVGGQTGDKYSKQNAQIRDQTLTQAATFAQALQAAGAKLTGTLYTNISNTRGFGVGTVKLPGTNRPDENDPNTEYFKRKDSAGFTAAVIEKIYKQATDVTGTIKTIIDKLGFKDMAKLSDGLNFGQQYDAIVKSLNPVDLLGDAITALTKQFDEMKTKAVELGLPVDKLNEAYEKQKKAITDSIKAQQAGFSNLESMTKAFKDFLDGQALGENSSLSPMGKLQLAQGNFDSLLGKARGGDASVTPDLLKAANDLINVSRSVYASSTSFAGIEGFVRTSISEIAKQLGVPGFATGTDSAPGGLAMVGERGPELRRLGRGDRVWSAGETAGILSLSGNTAQELVRSNGHMIGLYSEMLKETKELRKETRQMRKQTERMADRRKVTGA